MIRFPHLQGPRLQRSHPLQCFTQSRSVVRLQSCQLAARWSVFVNFEDTNFHVVPLGCMAHTYKPADAAACLSTKEIIFIGDSVTRHLFFQFANLVDPKLPTAPPNDEVKHQDYSLHSSNNVTLSFYWDPFMNTSYSQFIHSNGNDRVASAARRPALLVVGTGLWYLRYSDHSGGLPAWESRVESVLNVIKHARPKLADNMVFLPVEEPVTSKLSPERAASIHPSDVDAMNSDLYHRIYPSLQESRSASIINQSPYPVAFPLVFNQMLDGSDTKDGLHFSKPVVRAQANVLLNFHCNNEVPKHFPFDKTCCRSYPWPSMLHTVVYAALILWGPSLWLWSWWHGSFIPYCREPIISYVNCRSKQFYNLDKRRTKAPTDHQRRYSSHVYS